MAKLWVLLRDKLFDNIIKVIGLIILFIAVIVLPYLSKPIKDFINYIPNILLIALALFLLVTCFVLLTYVFYLREEKQKAISQPEMVKEDKFKNWEFLNKYGIWKSGNIYYCPNCKSKDIMSPLKVEDTGWYCPVKDCDTFYPNEKYIRPEPIYVGGKRKITRI